MKRLIVFLILFAYLIPAAAVDKKSQTTIRHKSRDLNKVKAQLKKKKKEAARLRKESDRLKKEMEKSRSKASGIKKSILMTEQKNTELNKNVAGTKNKFDQLGKDIQLQKENMNKTLNQYYVASLLNGPSSPLSVYTNHLYKEKSIHMNTTVKESERVEGDLEDLIGNQERLRLEVQRQRQYLSQLKKGITKKGKLLDKKKTKRELIEAELKDLQKTASELESLIDILRTKAKKEQEAERARRKAKQVSGHSPILARSLAWPARGVVVEKFGLQTHPRLGTPYNSNGLTIALNGPQDIKCVADGHVLFAGHFMSYGPMVLVEHPGDWYSVYGQLKGWVVEKGQRVQKGQPLGRSGVNEKGKNQYYFELRFYGKPTNPRPWLAK